MGASLVIFFLLCAAPLHAQRRSPSLRADHAAAIVDSTRRFLESFQEAFAAGDWGRVGAMYSADARFRWIESGSVTARSAEEIRRYLGAMPPGMKGVTSFTETEIFPLAPGVASVVTRFETRMGDPQAGGFSFGGAMSIVVVHEPGGWRFLQGHASGPVPRSR